MDLRFFRGLDLFLFYHQALIGVNTTVGLILKSLKKELSVCGFN